MAGFIGGAWSKESAIKMAELSLEEDRELKGAEAVDRELKAAEAEANATK